MTYPTQKLDFLERRLLHLPLGGRVYRLCCTPERCAKRLSLPKRDRKNPILLLSPSQFSSPSISESRAGTIAQASSTTKVFLLPAPLLLHGLSLFLRCDCTRPRFGDLYVLAISRVFYDYIFARVRLVVVIVVGAAAKFCPPLSPSYPSLP